MALTLARGSRAFAPSTASDAIHRAVDGVFMTLPAYSRSREGEGRELGCDVSNGSHTARSRPSQKQARAWNGPVKAASAQGTARCASRGQRHSMTREERDTHV